MAPEEFLEEVPPTLALLPLHFDIDSHVIKIDTLISGLKAVDEIAKGLNKVHFNDQLSLTVLALPSEEGGFLANVGLAVRLLGATSLATLGSAASAISIYESDVFASWYQECTGEELTKNAMSKELSEVFVCAVQGVLLTSVGEMTDFINRTPDFDGAIRSKTRLMRHCINDHDVRGLGFSSSHDFRITRGDFWKHISNIRERVKPIDILHLRGFVASSVVLEGTARQWAIRVTHSGQNKVDKPYEISAYLFDDDFAADLFKGHHPVREDAQPDAIEVEILVSKVTRDGKVVNKSMKQITKVISFKGERLVADDYEIGSASDFNPEQVDMFSGLDNDAEEG